MVKLLARAGGLLALLWQLAAHAAVTLDINPEPAVANQSVRLNFRVTGGVDADPDFSPLEKSFEILSRNRQTTMSWINGNSEQSTTWELNCMPRAVGRISIPAISFGRQSSTARDLEVVDVPAPSTAGDDNADILLKVSASTTTPYVQEQVVYTIKLLHLSDLSNPRFSEPSTSNDAVVRPLTNGRQFTEQLNGRTYDGYELKYVVFPQKSGTLRIAPLSLTTEVVVGRRSVFDPFAQSLSTKRIESEAIELEVKPVPASYPPGATWLPAKRLRLHEEWEPDVGSVEVGTPLTRTVFLWSDGLLSGQLPSVKFTTPAGIKLYPDQAQTNDQDTANGYTSVSQQKFAIVANQAGDAEFEEVALPWWNIETDQLEIARLPARKLTATPAAGAAPPAPVAALPSTSEAAAPVVNAAPTVGNDAETWRRVALLMALAWLTTVLLWWRSRGRADAAQAPASHHAAAPAPHGTGGNHELKAACAADDARGARDALLAWARTQAGAAPAPTSLRALADQTGGELATAIRALEKYLYGVDKTPWRGQALWQAFHDHPHQAKAAPATAPALPRLFKLGAG
ncbi:MAG: protein BatD [Proteobacteria bacterium]|nr:protein BatD [Pseudomonadota bacterium]